MCCCWCASESRNWFCLSVVKTWGLQKIFRWRGENLWNAVDSLICDIRLCALKITEEFQNFFFHLLLEYFVMLGVQCCRLSFQGIKLRLCVHFFNFVDSCWILAEWKYTRHRYAEIWFSFMWCIYVTVMQLFI